MPTRRGAAAFVAAAYEAGVGISFAAQYFSDHNDKSRSMIAYNYKDRVYGAIKHKGKWLAARITKHR